MSDTVRRSAVSDPPAHHPVGGLEQRYRGDGQFLRNAVCQDSSGEAGAEFLSALTGIIRGGERALPPTLQLPTFNRSGSAVRP